MSLPTLHHLAVALCLTTALAAAHAKPAGTCSTDGPGGNQVVVTSPSGHYFTDLTRTVVNTGTGNKTVFIWFSADAGVPAGAEVRLLFSVDGAAPQYRGPQNLANTTEYYQSRSALARVTVPPGSHTITPFVFVSAGPGVTAVFDDRCMFVEI